MEQFIEMTIDNTCVDKKILSSRYLRALSSHVFYVQCMIQNEIVKKKKTYIGNAVLLKFLQDDLSDLTVSELE